MLSSSPDPDEPIAVDKEFNHLREKLASSEVGRLVELDYWPDVRLDQVASRLYANRAQVLHFSGHATENGELVMRDHNGEPSVCGPDGMARLLRSFRDQLRCVVLVACYSDELGVRVSDAIDVVIGMRVEVDDEAAVLFVATFYEALAFGKSVAAAFEVAAAVMDAFEPGTGDPVLRVRDGVDAEQIFLASREAVPASVPSTPNPVLPASDSVDVPEVEEDGSDPPDPTAYAIHRRCPEPGRATLCIELARGVDPAFRSHPRRVFYAWPYSSPASLLPCEHLGRAVRDSLSPQTYEVDDLIPSEFYKPADRRSPDGLVWLSEPVDAFLTVGVDCSAAMSLRLWESVMANLAWGPTGIGIGSTALVLAEGLAFMHRLAARASEPVRPMHFAYWIDNVRERRFVYDGPGASQRLAWFASGPLTEDRLVVGGVFRPEDVPALAPPLIREAIARLTWLAGIDRLDDRYVDREIARALHRTGITAGAS